MKWKIDRVGFMPHGACWRVLELPQLRRYYSGNVYWLCWWRLYVVFERRGSWGGLAR